MGMALPMDLFLVRPGVSECPENAIDQHPNRWRLTQGGIAQAKASGHWLLTDAMPPFNRDAMPPFDRCFTSGHRPDMETAAYLGLPAQWNLESYLRSPDGVDQMLDLLNRECSGQRVVIVCHNAVIQAFRLRLEHLALERDGQTLYYTQIHDVRILHYTRQSSNFEPRTRTSADSSFSRFRMIRLDDRTSSNDWQPIVRPRLTSEELLAAVNENLTTYAEWQAAVRLRPGAEDRKHVKIPVSLLESMADTKPYEEATRIAIAILDSVLKGRDSYWESRGVNTWPNLTEWIVADALTDVRRTMDVTTEFELQIRYLVRYQPKQWAPLFERPYARAVVGATIEILRKTRAMDALVDALLD